MREIKFRQRDKNNSSWHYWGFVENKWVNPLMQDNYESPLLSDQYTEIKTPIREKGFNKHGDFAEYKEIYVSDIIEFHTDPFNNDILFDEKYVVCFQARLGGGFVLKPLKYYKMLNGCNGAYCKDKKTFRVIPPYEFSNLIWHYAVVGNLHENPELLEVGDEK